MKKLLLTIALVSFCFSTNAQFGASFGYASGKAKISIGGESMTGDSSGAFSIGVFYDSEISEKLDLLTSVGFGIGEKVEDESNNSIGIGVGLQYYPIGKDGNFFIQPGLGLGLSLANVDTDFIKKTVFSKLDQVLLSFIFFLSITCRFFSHFFLRNTHTKIPNK